MKARMRVSVSIGLWMGKNGSGEPDELAVAAGRAEEGDAEGRAVHFAKRDGDLRPAEQPRDAGERQRLGAIALEFLLCDDLERSGGGLRRYDGHHIRTHQRPEVALKIRPSLPGGSDRRFA